MDDADMSHCAAPAVLGPATLGNPQSSAESTPWTNSGPQAVRPKLGDFSRLRPGAISPLVSGRRPMPNSDGHLTPQPSPSQLVGQECCVKLGNFVKVLSELRLGISCSSTSPPPHPLSAPTADHAMCDAPQMLQESSLRGSSILGTGASAPTLLNAPSDVADDQADALLWSHAAAGTVPRTLAEPKSDKTSSCDSDFDKELPRSPPTTPPSSVERESLMHARSGEGASAPTTRLGSRRTLKDTYHCPLSHTAVILNYQPAEYGPIFPVLDQSRTRDEKHRSFTAGLVPLYATDKWINLSYPSVASNGIHVFLDMSNINISFQESLRRRYALPNKARFRPLPTLNLDFLTELLIRGRDCRVLNVGCSTQPGKRVPNYVHRLQDLGYRVDLRERKRLDEMKHSSWIPSTSSSEEMVPSHSVRYVEDLVDETLQTRIGESVMEYFQEQGTLVLATGDARPAQYSDGFFTYAERALKMGWNVEVVSWKCSLSSNWRNPVWTDQWAERFRVIELDGLLGELLV